MKRKDSVVVLVEKKGEDSVVVRRRGVHPSISFLLPRLRCRAIYQQAGQGEDRRLSQSQRRITALIVESSFGIKKVVSKPLYSMARSKTICSYEPVNHIWFVHRTSIRKSRDNVRNQREHLVLHLANAQMRLQTPPDPIDSLNPSVLIRFRRGLLSNYSSWCSYLGQKSKI
ncbi:hypothetical protein Syun_003310 [Stephania yunnanensis]|uniref:Uncharacterized protein n=1 Tax=Stephania yunnanensis TaxID=152371 RepID=A0AAP0L2G6_9MAGN